MECVNVWGSGDNESSGSVDTAVINRQDNSKVDMNGDEMQYNTIQYKICKAPCCRGFRGAGEQVS